MCTRSGKSYRGTMSEGGVGDSAAIGLMEMLKVLVEDRQQMEQKHVEVHAEERHSQPRHGERAEVGETYQAR